MNLTLTKNTKKRPVKCIFCKEQLYYCNHPKSEPEYTIDYGTSNHDLEHRVYAHQRCWNKIIK